MEFQLSNGFFKLKDLMLKGVGKSSLGRIMHVFDVGADICIGGGE